MRIVADENIHRGVVAGLRADGHDVLAISELRPSDPDDAVLALAREERAILITSDRDFGRLLVQDGEIAAAGVIYLRLPRRDIETILDRLRDLLKGDRDVADHLVVIAPAGDRWRSLRG